MHTTTRYQTDPTTMVRFAIKCLLVFGTIHKLLFWDFIFFLRQTRLTQTYLEKLFIGSNISKKWPCNFWTTPMHAEGEEDLIKGKLLSNLYSNSIVYVESFLVFPVCLQSTEAAQCSTIPKKVWNHFFEKSFERSSTKGGGWPSTRRNHYVWFSRFYWHFEILNRKMGY